MNFNEDREAKVKYIERVLKQYLPKQEGFQKNIMNAMEYSLLAGGKRIRPMLMFEVYQLLGGTSKIIEPFMAAIEMIHTYSLVHDDLPAMDNDEYRRGRKTTHIVYGEGMGILAGDALLNYAFETASEAFEKDPSLSYEIGTAIRILSKKSGIYGMIGGQVVDIEASGKNISLETLQFIFELKTSALIEASMMIGAVLAKADKETVDKVELIAKNIGIAFQIQDDILDVTSTSEALGKPTHSDEKNDKTTYISLKGLEKAKEDVRLISEEALNLLKELSGENTFLEALMKALIVREN